MTPAPEGKHFSVIWYALIILAAIISLPLEWHNLVPHWAAYAHLIAIFLLGMFVGAEEGASDVQKGLGGTMTNWMYSRVQNNVVRTLIGIWLSGIVMWRASLILGIPFLLWLPYHYSGRGAGPMDRFFTWVGKRFGLTIRTW